MTKIKEEPKTYIYRSRRNGQFAWRTKSPNGKKIACGGETYHNKKDVYSILAVLKMPFEIIDLTVKK